MFEEKHHSGTMVASSSSPSSSSSAMKHLSFLWTSATIKLLFGLFTLAKNVSESKQCGHKEQQK